VLKIDRQFGDRRSAMYLTLWLYSSVFSHDSVFSRQLAVHGCGTPDALAGVGAGVTRQSGHPMTTSFFVRWSATRRFAISS
jgi:hypothetical protein